MLLSTIYRSRCSTIRSPVLRVCLMNLIGLYIDQLAISHLFPFRTEKNLLTKLETVRRLHYSIYQTSEPNNSYRPIYFSELWAPTILSFFIFVTALATFLQVTDGTASYISEAMDVGGCSYFDDAISSKCFRRWSRISDFVTNNFPSPILNCLKWLIPPLTR